MSEDMSDPRRRQARIAMRENAQRAVDSRHEWEGLTSDQRLDKIIANQEAREARRSGAFDRMNNHYGGSAGRLLTGGEPAEKKAADKLEASARSFEYSPQMELLIEWEAKGDPRLDKITPAQRMSMGVYRRSKDAARKLGLSTAKPKDDPNAW